MNTKILLISDTVYDTNGVSRFIQDMAAQARENAEPFSVLSASPLAEAQPESNITNYVPVWTMRMPYYKEQFLTLLPPLIRMNRHIRETSPDVIHISTPGPVGLCAFLIAKYRGIPVAGTYHTDFPSYMRKQTGNSVIESMTRWSMRLFYGRMHGVFSRSNQYIGVLQRELGLQPEKLIFLPPGTNIKRFSPEHRREGLWQQYGLEEAPLKLLYVGRLSPEKNFMFVVDLFKKLKAQSRRPLSLIVLGEGTLSNDPKCRTDEDIHLLGIHKGQTLASMYASADLMLFASVTETLGQVIMEAQASGLPCIVSDQGGVADIVSHGISGFCIDVNDEAQWSEKLLELIESDDVRRQMGKEAYQAMQERSIEKTYTTFMQMHERMIEA